YSRRALSCALLLDSLFNTVESEGAVHLELRAAGGELLLRSRETWPDAAAALAVAAAVLPSLPRLGNYRIDNSGGPGALFYTLQGAGAVLSQDLRFDDAGDALRSIEALIGRYHEVLEGEA